MQYIRTPQEAEANAARQMRELGFSDAAVTRGGSDGGIDVRSRHALAQVKWRGGMVGRPELQNLYGARAADHSKSLLFFAASGYSQHATEYADACEIALFLYEPDGTLVSQNRWARTLTSRSFAVREPTGGIPAYAQKRANASTETNEVSKEFFKKHWRIIGAILLTLGSVGGVISLFNPQPGDQTSETIPALIASVICAAIFWYAAWEHHRNNKT